MGLEFLPSSIAHSGRWAPNLQGNLRSPTFTLTHNHLHLRVAGRSSKIRLIIARYGLREFNPLLFESTQIGVDADEPLEESEQAYAELVEFVRVGVQLLHDELARFRDQGVNTEVDDAPRSLH